MIKIGTKYVSKAGNIVKILEKETVDDDQNRPMTVFRGYVEKVAVGHEILRGKIQKFFDDGRWYVFPGGVHDLTREFE